MQNPIRTCNTFHNIFVHVDNYQVVLQYEVTGGIWDIGILPAFTCYEAEIAMMFHQEVCMQLLACPQDTPICATTVCM